MDNTVNSNGTKFTVGQNVVHYAHGLGKIVGIEEREFGKGNKQTFYILEVPDNGVPKKVFVPVDAVGDRLRPIVSKLEANQILAYVLNGEVDEPIDHAIWGRRYTVYMDLMRTGKLKDVATVYKALTSLSKEKELNFGERKLLELARQSLHAELDIHGYML
jgi:CarD family transcriptional regulator